MNPTSTKYTTIRLRAEDYARLKELRRYLMKKGIDSIDWQELRRQNIVEPPDEEDTETADSLTVGLLVGLGSAALARLVSKGSDK